MVAERVQGLAVAGLDKLPPQFIWPLNERPENSKALTGLHVPTVSFSPDCKQAAKASEEWGIFQLTDQGISPELFRRLKEAGEGFFSLPQEYKEQYANDFAGGVFEGYGTKLAKNPDQKLEWIDYFFHFMWPTSREKVDCVCCDCSLEALSVGLGLEAGALKEALGGEVMSLEMKINLYPPSPQPELALGVEAHTDMSALTILLPNQVPGLQVIKDGSWVSVDYVPDALVVHVGDQIEVNSRTYPCACALIFFFFFFWMFWATKFRASKWLQS
ncbi:hypothetical protein AMTRI_Chr04g246720 [Amborella trichopoda]